MVDFTDGNPFEECSHFYGRQPAQAQNSSRSRSAGPMHFPTSMQRAVDSEPLTYLEHLSVPSPQNNMRSFHACDDECLLEPEDIDFEFVYALHTFVATVEGQANASKGDTMVLLDDSNSYWWLVRVVKDSSIGELLFIEE